MTYRHLFLHLLVAGAILLAGIWWYSFRMYSGFSLARPDHKKVPGAVVGAVHCGTLSFVWNPAGGGYQMLELNSGPVSKLPPEDQYGVMGSFRIGPLQGENAPPDVRVLQLPLWLVYLLLVGSGFALMRWGERRSSSSAEKAHAQENHSGKEHPAP